MCNGGVMVTASHLPSDRNGFKFFTLNGGFTKVQIQRLLSLARDHVQVWYDLGILPPTSGPGAVFCSEWVNFMPRYQENLERALMKQVHSGADTTTTASSSSMEDDRDRRIQTLSGLKIVLNAGHGSGGFFQKVLSDLGADVSASIHIVPDGEFPAGYVPNPEDKVMVQDTIQACEAANADIGVLLDTDADRCGFVVPRTVRDDGTCADYEPLNRNRLIALLGVVFSTASPGCAIVTDSCTSNGLSTFLTQDLGLIHVRYLKGYANVISKARELTEETIVNAEVAIETSGHCAMRENDYLDDGTYTACKVIGLLAKEKCKKGRSLLELIQNLQEMQELVEIRMKVDGSLESMREMFDIAALQIELECEPPNTKGKANSSSSPRTGPTSGWTVDRENLEGIRVSTGDGGYFMLRRSLHDPVMILEVESTSKEAARSSVVEPLLRLFAAQDNIESRVNLEKLRAY
jgi:phosphomannomutase